ncbi:hypothetical protein V1264_016054 [Littorina saxatilis]|uniref:Polycystin cation channel PKD1/PKD2 domain-containing protein n=1 Tax=Littorina saxatilis TaxID=31220 RepID=A0AAN9BMM3_9CAEN
MALVWAYIALAFYITKILSVAKTMDKWRYDPKVYVDFYLPVLWDALYGYILAALVFVVTIRLLRVLGYNKRVTMLATVLARSGHALLGYSIMFFIVISAYVTAGHVLFGATNRQFRSLWDTYASLYVVLLGRNRIGKWISTAPLWAQIYHISLTFFVLFVLYSMFEAILCNVTSVIKSHLDTVPPPYGLTNVVAKFYRFFTDMIPSRFKPNNGIAPAEPVIIGAAPAGTQCDVTSGKEDSKDVSKKDLSTHRPDDRPKSATAIVLGDLKEEVQKLKKEMQEILAFEREERRRRKEEGKERKAERAARKATEKEKKEQEKKESSAQEGEKDGDGITTKNKKVGDKLNKKANSAAGKGKEKEKESMRKITKGGTTKRGQDTKDPVKKTRWM